MTYCRNRLAGLPRSWLEFLSISPLRLLLLHSSSLCARFRCVLYIVIIHSECSKGH